MELGATIRVLHRLRVVEAIAEQNDELRNLNAKLKPEIKPKVAAFGAPNADLNSEIVRLTNQVAEMREIERKCK